MTIAAVAPCRALEEVWVTGCKSGIVDKHNDSFTGEILIRVVVPVIFRSDRSVAYENNVGGIKAQLIGILALRPENNVFLWRHRQLGTIGCGKLEV